MFSDNDLTEAVAAGAISAEAAAALRARVAATRRLPRVDEEHYRILDGGNDGLVAFAAIIVMAGFGQIGWMAEHVLTGVLVAASAWGLAEYFVRVRRQTLTGIILGFAFFGGVIATLVLALFEAAPTMGPSGYAGAGAAILAIGGGAAWLYWRRFAVPFAMSLVALGGVGTVIAAALAVIVSGDNIFGAMPVIYAVALLCGLGVFAFAMRWDMSDRERVTDRHETGFWVHSVAGGLIVQSIFYFVGTGGSIMSPFAPAFFISSTSAIIIFALFAVFALIGLAIDRRSLIYASIGSVLFALAGLLAQAGVYATAIGWAALVTGGVLLALSAWWAPMRRAIVPLLGGIADRLPPVQRDDTVDPSIYE